MSVQNIKLEITIDNEGNVFYEVKGVTGKDCVELTKFLDEALGEVTDREYKREYYQQKSSTSRLIRTKR